jgi:hypothetical protein
MSTCPSCSITDDEAHCSFYSYTTIVTHINIKYNILQYQYLKDEFRNGHMYSGLATKQKTLID